MIAKRGLPTPSPGVTSAAEAPDLICWARVYAAATTLGPNRYVGPLAGRPRRLTPDSSSSSAGGSSGLVSASARDLLGHQHSGPCNVMPETSPALAASPAWFLCSSATSRPRAWGTTELNGAVRSSAACLSHLRRVLPQCRPTTSVPPKRHGCRAGCSASGRGSSSCRPTGAAKASRRRR